MAALALAALACPQPQPPPPGSPRLVLFLVIDQGRHDSLERARPWLNGGLGRLLEEAVSFDDAHHAHAVTYTAPGHATLATGLHPAHSGIVGNTWVDHATGEEVYCVEDRRGVSSPANLLGTTLSDWIRQRYPAAKVFTVSGKDRAAVLLGGQRADGAFWFDSRHGEMVSSRFYGDPPEWLEDFNHRGLVDARFGSLWEPLPVDPEAARGAGFEDLDEGPFDRAFPHALGGLGITPDRAFYASYYRSPFVDELVGLLGRELVVREGLGADEVPDFLGLSFSALDTVGHQFGPDSPEALDTVLRLDRVLGDLFDLLEERVGLERVLISLSSDHGVVPLPEVRALRGLLGRRAGAADVACLQSAGRQLEERFGFDPWLDGEDFYLDREALEEQGVAAEEVERETARLLESCPLVERVWTAREVAGPAPEQASWEEALFHHAYHPDRSPDLFVQLHEYDLGLLGVLTSHGTVYAYDTHVPMLLRIPGVPPHRVAERVHTVDLAPTLAELLQIPTPTDLDGVSRVGW